MRYSGCRSAGYVGRWEVKEIWLDEYCIPVSSQVKSLLISSSCGIPLENCLSQLHYFQPPIFSKYEQWFRCVQLYWDPPKESGENLIPVASACINHIYQLYSNFIFAIFFVFLPRWNRCSIMVLSTQVADWILSGMHLSKKTIIAVSFFACPPSDSYLYYNFSNVSTPLDLGLRRMELPLV